MIITTPHLQVLRLFFAVVLLTQAVLSPLQAAAAELVGGQKLYMTHCAGCHGEYGVSIMSQTPNLARAELFSLSDQSLADVVRSGREAMPPFVGILGDSEILDVIRYVRTLR